MTQKPDRDPHPPTPVGTPNDEPPVCAMCGKPISRDDLVCPHCGAKLVSG